MLKAAFVYAGAEPSGYEKYMLGERCSRAGLREYDLLPLHTEWAQYAVVVPMGEEALKQICDKKSIDKWHLSPLNSVYNTKAIPTYDFRRILREWPLNVYLEMTCKKAAQHMTAGPWPRKEERYVMGPCIDESIARIEALLAQPPEWLSIDIETGREQINTFGVAWSANDAIAIKTLPGNVPPVAFKALWDSIRKLCESGVPKVMQNGIFERTFLSRYGIRVENFAHDTMCAMKFLWPELEKGLDNVGRVYTMEPYWKDDGRVSSEEGKRKDWGDIRDWPRHFDYNCKDTSNTLIAMHAQRADLAERGLLSLYDNYIQKLFDPIYEMGAHGFPLNPAMQAALIAEYEAKSADLVKQLSAEINPRSAKQKQKLFRDKGYTLPKNRKTGGDTTDELALKRLRLKYPEDRDLSLLLEVAGVEKALSSYLRVRTLPDKRIRFMLDPHGTETGRMSCSSGPYGGFNAQTMTPYVKQMIEWAPESGRVFVEIDLAQAESRFVAYDAVEETLLGMLERGEDIHKYVAAEIYQKPMADVTHAERQLGKKSGHGANYSMGVATFQDSCLKEMDLVLDRRMASRVLESYHKLFPGIRKWHGQIRNTVYRERCLTNPCGRVRYFYGRCDDNTYREAYAYRPQSTVPDIVNHLMLALIAERSAGRTDFALHMQCHDSIYLSCQTALVDSICRFAHDLNNWHPDIILPAGRLRIPVESKSGRNLGAMTKWTM